MYKTDVYVEPLRSMICTVDYGVDYVFFMYESILKAVLRTNQLSKSVITNQTALELLCNLFATYASQLRENSNNFYTLVRDHGLLLHSFIDQRTRGSEC